MAKSPMTFVRVQPEVREQIDALAKAWGPVIPLTDSAVIRESIRRAFETEKKSKKNRQSLLDGA